MRAGLSSIRKKKKREMKKRKRKRLRRLTPGLSIQRTSGMLRSGRLRRRSSFSPKA